MYKKKSKSALISLVFILMISSFLISCSFQKRVYNRGFHIEWRERSGIIEGEKRQAIIAKKKNNSRSQKNTDTSNFRIAPTQANTATAFIPPTNHSIFCKDSIKTKNVTGQLSPITFNKEKVHTDSKENDEPRGEVSTGLAGFLTSIIGALLVLANVGFGILLLVIGFVFSLIGLFEHSIKHDLKALIFSLLGLGISGFILFKYVPPATMLFNVLAAFFVANPYLFFLLLFALIIFLLVIFLNHNN